MGNCGTIIRTTHLSKSVSHFKTLFSVNSPLPDTDTELFISPDVLITQTPENSFNIPPNLKHPVISTSILTSLDALILWLYVSVCITYPTIQILTNQVSELSLYHRYFFRTISKWSILIINDRVIRHIGLSVFRDFRVETYNSVVHFSARRFMR